MTLGSNTTINAAAGAGYAAYYSATGALSGEQYLSVGRGGTGAGTFTANAILIGNGTSAISAPGPTLTSSVMTFAGDGTLTSGAASAMNITAGTAINLTSPLTTVSGELSVGTGGGTWSMDGSGADMVFTGGSYTATLRAPSATRTTIAYTSDLPAGVDVISCATAAATAQKYITVANYAEADGKQLYVDFTYANTAASPTLRVNTLTARPIYISGAAAASGS